MPKGPQLLWNVPAAEVGLSSHNEPALAFVLYPRFTFFIRSFDHSPPFSPLFSLFLMFGAETHLPIHASKFHHQLDRAVWYNLYTGLAYGTPPIPIAFPLVVLFHACLIIHFALHLGMFLAVYLISMRILLCVRVLSISN